MRNSSRSLLLSAFLLLLVVCPFLGSEPLNYSEIWQPGSLSHRLFFEVRLPRMILVAVTGGALAALGGVYQTLFLNPLAEPYLLGISNAVTLGLVVGNLSLPFGATKWATSLIGYLFGGVLTLLVLLLGQLRASKERLVLFGMGAQFFLSSLLFLLISYHSQQMGGGAIRYLFGQIPWVSLSDAASFGVLVIVFLAVLSWLSPQLDGLALGDTAARTLGVNPNRARLIFLTLTSVLVGILVSQVGAIGFVGLVVPHVVRLIYSPQNMRATLHWSIAFGALFLCLSDVVSRLLMPPFEFPIGIITTLVGGPLFLALLWKK